MATAHSAKGSIGRDENKEAIWVGGRGDNQKGLNISFSLLVKWEAIGGFWAKKVSAPTYFGKYLLAAVLRIDYRKVGIRAR